MTEQITSSVPISGLHSAQPFSYLSTSFAGATHVATLEETSAGNFSIVTLLSRNEFNRQLSNTLVGPFISPLVVAIRAQKRQLEYNSFYISYLLQQITEEQLEEYASKLAISAKPINEEIISQHIIVLENLTGLSFTDTELADIFECDDKTIGDALKLTKL